MREEMRAFSRAEPELIHDERNKLVHVTFRPDPTDSARPT